IREEDIAPSELKWSTDDEKAIAYIGSHVDTKYYSAISEGKSAYLVWEKINKLFEGLNTANKLVLKIEFYNASQQPNESLLKYLDRIILITDKLKDLGWQTPESEICIKVISSIAPEYKPIQMACIMLSEKDLNVNYLRQQFALESKSSKPE